jgi:sulfur relay (sulfurtransferase) complex TusBCD TusD component (DsrE family)
MSGAIAFPAALEGKKLGLLISSHPDQPNFGRGLKLAEAALEAGVIVYLYCIDEAVAGVNDSRLQALKSRGLHLYACAYGAQRRTLPLNHLATFAGLSVVNELIAATDRFVSFN